ncbi:MAG: histidine kinase N-terminal 7TM domain-containing protein [Bacillota bacterium]|nr:histidine kinase N-terminal 7TM domain-containing protein [Bacillota bacterium]
MRFLLSTNAILPLISAVLSFLMIVYFIFKGKNSGLFICYICCQVMVFCWSLGYACELMSQEFSHKLLFIKINYFCICFLSLGWLVFCNLFVENKRFLNKKYIIAAAVIPVINYIIVLTNDYHKQFQVITETEKGRRLFFWVILGATYLYIFLGILVLASNYRNLKRNAKLQTIALILAVLIPIASNFLSVINILKVDYDLTPVSFSVTMLFVAIATFRYRFLDLAPIARKEIVENMNDSVLVLNIYNQVVDWNKAFVNNFINGGEIEKNTDLFMVMNRIQMLSSAKIDPDFIEAVSSSGVAGLTSEISLLNPNKKTYQIKVHAINNKHGEMLAKVLTFSDITEYINIMDELNDKNNELYAMNDELSKYASTVEELAIAKERNRFAHDVHDTLGHTMTLLISILEVANITYKNDVDTTGEKLREALKTSKEGLKELRRSISGLMPEKLSSNNFVTSIRNMFSDFRLSGIEIDFSVEGVEPLDMSKYSDVLYRVCQEALTNSVRHGKAKNINIFLRFQKGGIRLFIIDDGIGCGEIKKGFGLSGMEERLKTVNGSIVYGSDGESGFNLRIEIPFESD